MNFVPFAEKCVDLVIDLYKSTAKHATVIQGHILQHIIKVGSRSSVTVRLILNIFKKNLWCAVQLKNKPVGELDV